MPAFCDAMTQGDLAGRVYLITNSYGGWAKRSVPTIDDNYFPIGAWTPRGRRRSRTTTKRVI
jgi:hypothetical protein